MAKKTFSDENWQQKMIDAAWKKQQKSTAKKKTVKGSKTSKKEVKG